MAGWRNREVERERMLLERIVALLVALAGLADLAACASSRRRREVLEILFDGEEVARDMIAGLAGLPPEPEDAGLQPQPENAGLRPQPESAGLPLRPENAGLRPRSKDAFSAADGMSNSADDARRLATTFRVLALVLHTLIEDARRPQLSPILSAWMKASCGMSTLPNWRIRFLPSFCFSSSLRLRVTSPP